MLGKTAPHMLHISEFYKSDVVFHERLARDISYGIQFHGFV